MYITVETLTGTEITLAVEDFDEVRDIKAQIKDKEGIPTYKQKLTFLGELLENSRTLLDYGIKNGNTIHLNFPVPRAKGR